MISREPATKLVPLSVGSARLSESKIATLNRNDTECFQRLTASDCSAKAAGENVTLTDDATASGDGFNQPDLTVFGFQFLFVPSENAVAQASHTASDFSDFAGNAIHSTPEVFAQNIPRISDIVDQKNQGILRKSATHFLQKPDEQNPASDSKISLTPFQIGTPKTADLTPVIASSMMLPNVPHAQTETVRLADLPQVTRVQVDQIKRNSAGVLTSLELVLEPEKLGRITAKIEHDEGRVTLVLRAEHSAIADDLARDSGLLLRVLSDQLPGVNKMAVFVQTEARSSLELHGQNFAGLHSKNDGQKPRPERPYGIEPGTPNRQNEVPVVKTNTTVLQIRI
jgi:Flagellar hook-length control protein FliK